MYVHAVIVFNPDDGKQPKTFGSNILIFSNQVNLTKTWELHLQGKTTRTSPEALEIIGRKEKLKLLGVTFVQVPVNWTLILIIYLVRLAVGCTF